MRVTPCSVHNECAGILAYGLGESFWSFLRDDVPPTMFAGEGSIEGRSIRVLSILECRYDNLFFEARFTLNKVIR